MERIFIIIALFLVVGCASKESLPPQEMVDEIRVERTHPNTELLILKDIETIESIVAFINTKKHGWSVPWYGPPVGQIYLNLYKNEKFVGNFYIGPKFFGRDYGNFWSQTANDEDIEKFGSLLGLDLMELINAPE